MLASADKNGKVKLWPQVGNAMAKVAAAFWVQPPMPPVAPRHLSADLLFYTQTPSRRTLLCHAAAADNSQWIHSLMTYADRPEFLTTCLTRRDSEGRCALDYALLNRNEPVYPRKGSNAGRPASSAATNAGSAASELGRSSSVRAVMLVDRRCG